MVYLLDGNGDIRYIGGTSIGPVGLNLNGFDAKKIFGQTEIYGVSNNEVYGFTVGQGIISNVADIGGKLVAMANNGDVIIHKTNNDLVRFEISAGTTYLIDSNVVAIDIEDFGNKVLVSTGSKVVSYPISGQIIDTQPPLLSFEDTLTVPCDSFP